MMTIVVSVWKPGRTAFEEKYNQDHAVNYAQLSTYSFSKPGCHEVLVYVRRGKIEAVNFDPSTMHVFLSPKAEFQIYENTELPQPKELTVAGNYSPNGGAA